MATNSSKKTVGLRGDNSHTVRQETNKTAADELPEQLHEWCVQMGLMPLQNLPSVEELSNLCRGVARPALINIMRHCQPRDRVLAFRRSRSVAAQSGLSKKAERCKLEKRLQETIAEVERWETECTNLETQLKDTHRESRECTKKTEFLEAQTRMLAMKAGELGMQLRRNELVAQSAQSLVPSSPSLDARMPSEKRQKALLAQLKAAGRLESELTAVTSEISCAELHDCLLHAQVQLTHRAQAISSQREPSAKKSMLKGELKRLKNELLRATLAARAAATKTTALYDEQAELEMACVDAFASTQSQLVDVEVPLDNVRRWVNAQAQQAAIVSWSAKLAALQAQPAARKQMADKAAFSAGVLRAQQELTEQYGSLQESLTALERSEANAEWSHEQALEALATSTLPADAKEARKLLKVLDVSSGDVTSTSKEESATKPSLKERIIEAEELVAKHLNAKRYLKALDDIDMPKTERLDGGPASNLRAAETVVQDTIDRQLAQLDVGLGAMANEIRLASEAATNFREHPVQAVIPVDQRVAGKSFKQWQEQWDAKYAKG